MAAHFEIDCRAGSVPLEKKTFKQYSDYVMELKERDNKHRTIHRYKQLLERINEDIGHMKLTDITGEHLNRLYMKLNRKGAKKRPVNLFHLKQSFTIIGLFMQYLLRL